MWSSCTIYIKPTQHKKSQPRKRKRKRMEEIQTLSRTSTRLTLSRNKNRLETHSITEISGVNNVELHAIRKPLILQSLNISPTPHHPLAQESQLEATKPQPLSSLSTSSNYPSIPSHLSCAPPSHLSTVYRQSNTKATNLMRAIAMNESATDLNLGRRCRITRSG